MSSPATFSKSTPTSPTTRTNFDMPLTPATSPMHVPHGPRRKPSVTFQDDCVYIDSNPLSYTENGIKRMLQMPGMIRRRSSDNHPTPRRRLSLSMLPSSPKIRMPRKWSYGPQTPVAPAKPALRSTASHSNAQLPTPPHTAPPATYAFTSASVSSPSLLGASATAAGPVRSPRLSSDETGVRLSGTQAERMQGAGVEVSSETARQHKQSTGSLEPIVTNTEKMTDSPRSSTTLIDLADDANVQLRNVSVARPNLHIAPHIQSAAPIRASTLPANTSYGDLTSLPEGREAHVFCSPSSPTLVSPTGSEQNVWLCSRPLRSPVSPLGDRPIPAAAVAMSRSTSANSITTPPNAGCKLIRPFVTRSMSTGRLAREFDDDGRIVCLSVHSDRILQEKEANAFCGTDLGPARPGVARFASSRGTTSSPVPHRASVPSVGLPRVNSLKGCVDSVEMSENAMSTKERRGYAEMDQAPVVVAKPRNRGGRASVGPQLEKVREWFNVA